MPNITEINNDNKFTKLKQQLNLYQKITKDNYCGERTIIVLSSSNFLFLGLKKTPCAPAFEEKFLFFLFLLCFSNTKIIYVVSQALPEYIIDYYLKIITDNPIKIKNMRQRLVMINLKNRSEVPVAYKLLSQPDKIDEIKSHIADCKTTCIRCYNSTDYENQIAVKLGIPLYGIDSKLNYFGTKSGSIYTFKKNNIPMIDGFSDLKNQQDIIKAIAKLILKYPRQQKLIIKIEDFPAGEGNVIFDIAKLRKITDGDLNKTSKIANCVKKYLHQCSQQGEQPSGKKFSYYFPAAKDYFCQFDKTGGIVELYIDAKEKYSPSCQIRILPNKKITILSTHEQVLTGKYKTEYIGCSFPAREMYRKAIADYSYKIAKYLAKKGVIGRFGVDFLTYRSNKNEKLKLAANEINLRKGSTTHPYELARLATGAHYSRKTGLLCAGKTNIYYYATDYIANIKWKGKNAKDLIDLLEKHHLSFNRNTKKGVIIHLFGTLKNNGRFGATFIGSSKTGVDRLYKKTIKILDRKL